MAEHHILEMAQAEMTAKIFKLVAPLYKVDRKVSLVAKAKRLLRPIHAIVKSASQLNRSARHDPNTIWQWTEIWKDSRFDPSTTECTNLVEVFETTSYKASENGTYAVREGREDWPDPIVRMVVFPGLVVWKKHTAGSGSIGDVATRIMKNVALVEWARQRRLTKIAGTSEHREVLAGGNTQQFDEDEKGVVELWELWRACHKYEPKRL